MTAHTIDFDKGIRSAPLLLVERLQITTHKIIEARFCAQRPFECGNGIEIDGADVRVSYVDTLAPQPRH